jgi:signal transduction histidine kinase
LALIDPEKLRLNTNPPPVVIESVLIDGIEMRTNLLRSDWLQALVLPADKEGLEIHYASLNLGAPERARFRYRLEGHESVWIEAGNSRVAHYSKLPPRKYRFQVTACNEDGMWNPTGSRISIEALPPFWRTWWFLSGVGVGLLASVVGAVHYVSTQRLQRQLERMRQKEALERDRARIARDLHDQLGASLTQISLLGEMAESDRDLPDEITQHARQIVQTSRETTGVLDEIVWAVNPSNDTLDGLITYACKYAQDYLSVAGVRYRLDVPAALPTHPIAPEVRHNVFLAFKEAVTNVVRHAKASAVWIRLHLNPATFTLEIEDDGRGLAGIAGREGRNGLRNMRRRMEDIGGAFSITPGPERGAIVRLTAPVGKE